LKKLETFEGPPLNTIIQPTEFSTTLQCDNTPDKVLKGRRFNQSFALLIVFAYVLLKMLVLPLV